MAADILEVHVDARRHCRAQLVRKISHAMIQRHVHAQRLQIGTLGLATGDGDHARALQLGQLRHGRAHRPGRGGYHQRLARLQTGDFMQAGIGGEAGHAIYPQRRTERQPGRIQTTPQRLGRQHRVGLPATRRQHQLACGYALGLGLQHLGHGLAFHHRPYRHRRGIRRALVHASSHVRVQREVAVAQQHFALGQCRQRNLFQAEIGCTWRPLRTRGKHDAGRGGGIGHGQVSAVASIGKGLPTLRCGDPRWRPRKQRSTARTRAGPAHPLPLQLWRTRRPADFHRRRQSMGHAPLHNGGSSTCERAEGNVKKSWQNACRRQPTSVIYASLAATSLQRNMWPSSSVGRAGD